MKMCGIGAEKFGGRFETDPALKKRAL